MPLVGIVDPTHTERANAETGRYPSWSKLDDILATAESATPKWSPWPYELVKSLADQHQERGARLSVTALTGGCMRGNIVERKEDYVAQLDDMYAALRGSMIHRTLEFAARPGSLAEWRFYTDVKGIEISGSPDLITYDCLWDYKTTENPPAFDYMYNGHKLQLQFNRYIFNNAKKWDAPPGLDAQNDLVLDPHNTRMQHLAIVYLGPKGPKVIETTKKDPKGGRYRVPDVWTDKQVFEELAPRVEAWKMAWDAYPNWPAGLEKFPGWDGPPEWKCHGAPLCYLPNCMAKRLPHGLTW